MLNRKIIMALACLGVASGVSLTSQSVAQNVPNTDNRNGINTPANPNNVNNPNNPNNINNRNNPNLNNPGALNERDTLDNRMGANRPLLPAGITPKDLNSERAIERAFKGVTEAAMNKTGFDNLVSYLVDQDRDRINKSLTSGTLNNINGSKNQRFTDVIASIEGGWKTKYANQNFDIDIAKAYANNAFIIQTGEVVDAQMLVGKWPAQVSLMSGNAGKLTQAGADEAKNNLFGGDVNLEKGRNVAVVQFTHSQYFGGLNASLIHEAGGWKFDVPNTLTAQKLYDNVVANLTTLDRARDQWPADSNEAYRRFTQAVVAALYDAPYPGEVMKSVPGSAMAK